MDRVAVTLVNRSPSSEAARIMLRDYSFSGPAAVATLTEGDGEDRVLPDGATSRLAEESEAATGGVLALTLPPRSFTVIEAPIGPA
jgi:hypothetical protein